MILLGWEQKFGEDFAMKARPGFAGLWVNTYLIFI